MNWKRDIYDIILVIVDHLIKIIWYKLLKITINEARLAKVIIKMLLKYHDFLELIVHDRGSLFTSKFWNLLCSTFSTKWKPLTVFHLQTNSYIKRQNSTIKAYLCVFVNREQNDRARLVSMTEITYNNTKDISTGYTIVDLNCSYHRCVFFENEVNFYSRSSSANKLIKELRKLMSIC